MKPLAVGLFIIFLIPNLNLFNFHRFSLFMGCVIDAIDVYLRRASSDTNPRIVRMISPSGTPEDHWYYRSDQAVATSEFILFHPPGTLNELLVEPFEGTLEEMPEPVRPYFSEDRCELSEIDTNNAQRAHHAGSRTFRDHVQYLSSLLR